MQRFCQSICISFDLFSVVALKGFLKFCNSIIDFLDLSRICLVAKILDGLFSLINQSFCIVLCSDSFLAFLVFCSSAVQCGAAGYNQIQTLFFL